MVPGRQNLFCVVVHLLRRPHRNTHESIVFWEEHKQYSGLVKNGDVKCPKAWPKPWHREHLTKRPSLRRQLCNNILLPVLHQLVTLIRAVQCQLRKPITEADQNDTKTE